MKNRLILAAFLCYISIVNSQNEFNQYQNGLIYSPVAISNLQQIVSVENQQFRVCELSKNFKAPEQSTVYVYTIPKTQKRSVLRDIYKNISLEDFLNKYGFKKGKRELAVFRKYKNYNDREKSEIMLYPEGRSVYTSLANVYNRTHKNWLVVDKSEDDLEIIYLNEIIHTPKIPYKYARMIQYSECMVDTTTTIHPETAGRGYYGYGDQEKSTFLAQLLNYIYDELNLDEPYCDHDNSDFDYDNYIAEVEKYEAQKERFIEEELSGDKKFNQLLRNAYDEALETKISNNEFEGYVEKYLSKKRALQLKRNRVVVGTCSMDSSPRYHAVKIAKLSAESFSWDIFVRSHLNIMNDNFQRTSDGSYAWKQRNTYIKELEVLNINVKDLLLGITFRISEPGEYHYFGSVRRLGRAISESEDVEVFRTAIEEGVSDKYLDHYNRVLLFYLYNNVHYNETINKGLEYDDASLNWLRAKLPDYLQSI